MSQGKFYKVKIASVNMVAAAIMSFYPKASLEWHYSTCGKLYCKFKHWGRNGNINAHHVLWSPKACVAYRADPLFSSAHKRISLCNSKSRIIVSFSLVGKYWQKLMYVKPLLEKKGKCFFAFFNFLGAIIIRINAYFTLWSFLNFFFQFYMSKPSFSDGLGRFTSTNIW